MTFSLDDYAGFVLESWQGSPTDLLQSARQLFVESGEILKVFNKLDYKPNSSYSTMDILMEFGDLIYYAILTAKMTDTFEMIRDEIKVDVLFELEKIDPQNSWEVAKALFNISSRTQQVLGLAFAENPNTEQVGIYLGDILFKIDAFLFAYDTTLLECARWNMYKLQSSSFNGWRA